MTALGVVLILVFGSIVLTASLSSPVLDAMDAVNTFEAHLLRSHLALEEDTRAESAPADVLVPLRAAGSLCDEVLADFALEEGFAEGHQHPCAGLVALRELTEHELDPGHGDADSHRHEEYEATWAVVIADAEALDSSVSAAFARAQGWVRLVQVVTAGILVGLVVLIGLAARAHRRHNERLHAELRRQATHDPLTGLLNRLALRRVLDQASAEQRVSGVLFLDLDGFKKVNDTAGHASGDHLLIAIAERLCSLIRPEDTAVRLGGDEFAVVCADADEATAMAVAERIVAGLRRPVLVDGHALTVSASVGVSSSADDPAGGTDLKRQADIAMYIAKAHGGDRAEAYRPQMHAEIVERIQLIEDLETAIDDGSIAVSYQPIVTAMTGRITSVEALARWSHPTRGAIAPDVFIGLAEQAGLISALGKQVLERACWQVRAWQRHHPAAAELGVAVNVSTLQLADNGFADTVSDVLERTGLAAKHLTIEVTEGALTGSHTDAEAVLGQLRQLGIRIAVDDFGTGHSSLSRLRHLRIHELKIDRSFVAPIGEDASAEPLVESILALAASLGLEVVAEGVETPEQLAFLAAHGCDNVQGYLLSKPRSAADCAELFADKAESADVAESIGSPAAIPITVALGSGASGNGHSPTLGEMLDPMNGARKLTRPMLASMLAKIAALTGLEAAYLTRIDWDGGIQHIEAAHNTGAPPLVAEGLEVPWSDTVCLRMLTAGPAATSDALIDYRDAPAAVQLQLQTYIGVPVVDDHGDIYGTLCAASRERTPVADTTIAVMEMFAAIISAQLHHRGVAVPP